MRALETLIQVGGVLHCSLLIAAALLPFVLEWKTELPKIGRLSQQIVWVHGIFIALVIAGFGVVSLLCSAELAGGTPLARALCGFIAFFWGLRLAIQAFVFDAESHLTHWYLRLGYRGLTGVFTYLALIYGIAATRSIG